MNKVPVDTSDTTNDADGGSNSPDDVILALTSLLDKTVRALADAGEPVLASQLAAQAWSSLRSSHPECAERLNRAMHYLARREAALETNAAQ